MDIPKKYLHDRLILALLSVMSAVLVVGVSLVLLRYDVTKSSTTIISFHPNVSGSSYTTGKSIDIYVLAVFMIFTAVVAMLLSARTYNIRRYISVYILASATVLIILASIVFNALVSLR